MELRHLEYLVAVIEEASFTRAAERLHVAQPGVSAQIRQFERELGQSLLDRSTRTVRPTEAGCAVLPHARAALDAVASIRIAIDELAGLMRGHISVGTVAIGGSAGLPDRLADFHEQHPEVEITLIEDTSERLLAGIATGLLDLALVGLTADDPQGIGIDVIADRPLVGVVSPDHPLAGRSTVELAELADNPLMTLPKGFGIRAALDAGFAKTGLRPRIAFEASDPATLLRLASRGLGVAVLPAAEQEEDGPSLHEIPITDPAMRTRLALAWRVEAPLGPAAKALIEYITRTAPSMD